MGKGAYEIEPDRAKYLTYNPPSRFVFDAPNINGNQQNAPNVVLNQPELVIPPSSSHVASVDWRNSNELIGTCLQASSDDLEELVGTSQVKNSPRLSYNSENQEEDSFDLAMYEDYEAVRFQEIVTPNLANELGTFIAEAIESQPYPSTLSTPAAHITDNLPLESSVDMTHAGRSGGDQPIKSNIHKPVNQSQSSSPTQSAKGTNSKGFGGDVDDDFVQYSSPTDVVSATNCDGLEDDGYERLSAVDKSEDSSSWLAENSPFQSNYDLPVPDRLDLILTQACDLGATCVCPYTSALLVVGLLYALWDLGYVN